MDAVEALAADPTDQDVARRLHQALPFDDPLPVAREPALAEERFEHRRLGLLELEDERVGVVAADQDEDVGAGADAADADDLPRAVDVAVALDEPPPVARQRPPVGAERPRG